MLKTYAENTVKQFWPHGTGEAYFQASMRLALCVAMLSYFFQEMTDLPSFIRKEEWLVVLGLGVTFVSSVGVLHEKYSRLALCFFIAGAVPGVLERWETFANHGWLAVWTIFAAALFSRWWDEESYSRYLSITLGFVMLAAAAQKLVAGTYLDGSYITYLSYSAATTESAFAFLCNQAVAYEFGCFAHKFLGTFIVVWQVVVGILLIAGLRNIWFLCIEIGFLLGAGFYADEMNFQVLNIALLCVAFRVGMPKWLFWLALAFLLIDMHGISEFINDMGF